MSDVKKGGWVVSCDCAVKSLNSCRMNITKMDSVYIIYLIPKGNMMIPIKICLNSKDINSACKEADMVIKEYLSSIRNAVDKMLTEFLEV